MFSNLKTTSALNDPGPSRPIDNAENQKEAATERAAGIAIGLVSVLDSLILCLAVDRTGRHASRYWELKRALAQYRKQHAVAIDSLRTARRHVKQWQLVWDTRQERLKAIADAMRAREECLRSPRLPKVPPRVPTPVEWVEQTLQMQHQILPYVN